MSFSSLFKQSGISKSAQERRAYWRTIPLSRLKFLLLAVFFTFGTIGLLSSILSAGQRPLILGLGWAVVTGGTSILYVLVFARKPIFFLPVLIFQMLITTGYGRLGAALVDRHWLQPAPERTALSIFVVASILSLVISYVCFLAFIEREGKQAVRAQAELALAHGIQQTLVPRLDLTVAGCQILGVSMPSEKVGGDIVDVVPLSDGGAVAYVADVAGHGLNAGILMGMVKTAARTRLLDESRLDVLFDTLNRIMPEVKEEHMYATCAALRIWPAESDGSFPVEFAVAGHPPILRMSRESGEATYFTDEQLPLGLFSFAEYRSQRFHCRQGDLLAITTDGILEVEAADGTEFGWGPVQSVMRTGLRAPLSELVTNILAAANAFGKQTDDQTLLLVRVL